MLQKLRECSVYLSRSLVDQTISHVFSTYTRKIEKDVMDVVCMTRIGIHVIGVLIFSCTLKNMGRPGYASTKP